MNLRLEGSKAQMSINSTFTDWMTVNFASEGKIFSEIKIWNQN